MVRLAEVIAVNSLCPKALQKDKGIATRRSNLVTWFETLTGCTEHDADHVRRELSVDGTHLHSGANGKSWHCGTLTTPSLAELRQAALALPDANRPTTIREVVADIQALHCYRSNAGAMFQVASQFNLLEMIAPDVTPERGIGIYERDPTQGPACAIACGAGTIYRNYFAPLPGQTGQTANQQIDCLADLGQRLGNAEGKLWEMTNGYALPSMSGLTAVDNHLQTSEAVELDNLRGLLRIGLQVDTEVTLSGAGHNVSQAFCSACPVAYSEHPPETWQRLASLVLDAAYEATLCAAMTNARRTSNHQLYLTLLGGGAFGNPTAWITNAIQRAVALHPDCGLDIAIVSYRNSKPAVAACVQSIQALLRDRTQ